jgi:hypothetical protein
MGLVQIATGMRGEGEVGTQIGTGRLSTGQDRTGLGEIAACPKVAEKLTFRNAMGSSGMKRSAFRDRPAQPHRRRTASKPSAGHKRDTQRHRSGYLIDLFRFHKGFEPLLPP